jgi:hypothetical protein
MLQSNLDMLYIFIKRFIFEKEDEFSMENGHEEDLSIQKQILIKNHNTTFMRTLLLENEHFLCYQG